MSSDADIEKALVKKSVELRCSSLSLSLALAAAAICILVVPCAAAASYTKAALGAQWALIRAEATDKGAPQAVTIGMFRICYKSPIVSCLPFQWGLDLDPTSFKGGDAWKQVLPSAIMVQAWSGLSAAACIFTFMASFTFCRCAPTPFVWTLGVITTLVDLSYFSITAGLYFLMRTRITSLTTYTPKPVQATLVAYIVTICLLLLVALGAFVLHETDTSEQEWRRWRRKKEEDEDTKQQAIHFQLWNTRAWVNRKFAYGLGQQPRWQQLFFTGGRAALFRHYGANNWKNPYETDEDLKKEVEQIAAFRAEWVEIHDDDKAVVDEAVVEQQISDIELTRDREKLEKKRILGDISEKEYWETRRKLEKKRAKAKASKVQRANIAKKMENIADTDAVSEDTKKEFIKLQRFQLLALSRAGRRLDPRQMDFLKRTRHLAEPPKPAPQATPEAPPSTQQNEPPGNASDLPPQIPAQAHLRPYQQMRDAFGRPLPVQQAQASPQPSSIAPGQTDDAQSAQSAVPSARNQSMGPSASAPTSITPPSAQTSLPATATVQEAAPASVNPTHAKDLAVAAATAFAAKKFANNKQGNRPNLAKVAMSASAGIQQHRKSAAFKKPNAQFLAAANDVLAANAVSRQASNNKRITRLRMTVMMAAQHEKSGMKIAKDFVKAQGAVDLAALADLTQKIRESTPAAVIQGNPVRQQSPMRLLPRTPDSPPLCMPIPASMPMPAPAHTERMSPPQARAYIKPLKKVIAAKVAPRVESPPGDNVQRQRSPSPVIPRAPSPLRMPAVALERAVSPQQIRPAARFANAVQTLLPVNMPAAPLRQASPQPPPIVEAAPLPAAMANQKPEQPEQRKIAALPNMPFPGVSELMKSIPLIEVKKTTKTAPPPSDAEEIVLSAARLPQEQGLATDLVNKPNMPEFPEEKEETEEKKEPTRDTMLLAWK